MAQIEMLQPVSRRSALRLIGGAVVVAAGSAALAACGSGGGTAANGSSSTKGGGAAAAAPWKITGGTGMKSKLATISGTTATLVMRGDDIWNTAGTFTFLYGPTAKGKNSWVCLVKSMDSTNGWAKAGIMAANSYDPGSALVFQCVTIANGITLQHRDTDAANETGNESVAPAPQSVPAWLKLDVDDSWNWTGSWSTDGKAWQNPTPAATNPIALNAKYIVGLATTAHDATMNGNAVISNLSGFKPLPATVDGVGTNDTATL